MMACDGAGLCVGRVVVGDDQSVYRVGILAACHLLRPSVDDGLQAVHRGGRYIFAVDAVQTGFLQRVHSLSPRLDFFVDMNKCEGNPMDVAQAHFVYVFQRERAGSEITWVGVFLVALHIETFKVVIADDGLTTNHKVPL